MDTVTRLYIVVSSALSAGLKAAQACHATVAFTQSWPELARAWSEGSNNLVVLEAADLPPLADRLEAAGLRVVRFHEPDLADALTAFVAEPAAARRLSSLPLAR